MQGGQRQTVFGPIQPLWSAPGARDPLIEALLSLVGAPPGAGINYASAPGLAGRSAEAVLAGLLALLPPGWAVPRARDAVLARLLGAPAAEIAEAETRALALVGQSDPRAADALLPDYERVLGPDACDPAGPSAIEERRRVAHQRWTGRGSASIAYLVGLAASRGVPISIEERVPFKAGRSKAGQNLALRDCRFSFRVNLPATRVRVFRAGSGRAGQSLGSIEASIAECPISRAAPAHTIPVFAYGAP